MARPLLGVFFLAAGALHFLRPRPYVAIVFPADLNLAVDADRFRSAPRPLLPVQELLIAWVWRVAVR